MLQGVDLDMGQQEVVALTGDVFKLKKIYIFDECSISDNKNHLPIFEAILLHYMVYS